jgi:hypothetical protein
MGILVRGSAQRATSLRERSTPPPAGFTKNQHFTACHWAMRVNTQAHYLNDHEMLL